MRTLAEKYPEFQIEIGLRDYYLAEAERLRADFDKSAELTEKLGLGRSIESLPRSRRRVRPQNRRPRLSTKQESPPRGELF